VYVPALWIGMGRLAPAGVGGEAVMVLVLIIILVVVMLGGLPNSPWGGWHGLGYYPSSIVGVLLVVLVILLLMGRL